MNLLPLFSWRVAPGKRARNPRESWVLRLLALAVLCLVLAVEFSR